MITKRETKDWCCACGSKDTKNPETFSFALSEEANPGCSITLCKECQFELLKLLIPNKQYCIIDFEKCGHRVHETREFNIAGYALIQPYKKLDALCPKCRKVR